ncbi:unnamed protein product [Cunninghamella echinulata]
MMFKSLVTLVFVWACIILPVLAGGRKCNCHFGSTATKGCCNRFGGHFENSGWLGKCRDPNSKGQNNWRLCCKEYSKMSGYDCWDYN